MIRGIGLCLFLVIVSFGLAYFRINQQLQSPEFVEALQTYCHQKWNIDAEFEPFTWTFGFIHSPSMKGKGLPGSSIISIEANRLSVHLKWGDFFQGNWHLKKLSIRQADIVFQEPLSLSKKKMPQPATTVDASIVDNIVIQQLRLAWFPKSEEPGVLENLRLHIAPTDEGWSIQGKNGVLKQRHFEIAVPRLEARYIGSSLLVDDAELRGPSGGAMIVRGAIDCSAARKVHLNAAIEGFSIEPLLPRRLRPFISGVLYGQISLDGTLESSKALLGSGQLQLADGMISGIASLQKYEKWLPQWACKKINFRDVSCKLRLYKGQLNLSQITFEIEKLARIEGNLATRGNRIEAYLQLGVTPVCIQKIPGAAARVFNTSAKGFYWTPWHISGTWSAPSEDLSARLRSAAGQTLQQDALDILSSWLDVIKGAIPFSFSSGARVLGGSEFTNQNFFLNKR